MGLHRRAERGAEPAPQRLHLADVLGELGRAPVGGVEDLLALDLRLGDHELRLLDRRPLQVLGERLGGEERLPQGVLVGGEILDAGLEGADLLAQPLASRTSASKSSAASRRKVSTSAGS
jgi:hypothetical protein